MMSVDEIADTILGHLREKWEAECLHEDANTSQSGGLHLPAAFAGMDLAQEDCTPDVLRALWAIEPEFDDFYCVNINSSIPKE